jgi:hypothetical protein
MNSGKTTFGQIGCLLKAPEKKFEVDGFVVVILQVELIAMNPATQAALNIQFFRKCAETL